MCDTLTLNNTESYRSTPPHPDPPAPPSPPHNQLGHLPAFSTVSIVWALDLPTIDPVKLIRGLATYAPMIYTSLCIMFWMLAYPLLEFFGPQMELTYWLITVSQGPKTREFQGPTPSHFPS
jgi:hypothetical protein